MQTGLCKFGATCKFNHPQPTQMKALVSNSGSPGYPSNSSLGAASTHLIPTGLQSCSLAKPQYMPRPRFQSPPNFTTLIGQQPRNMVVIPPTWNTYQVRKLTLGFFVAFHDNRKGRRFKPQYCPWSD